MNIIIYVILFNMILNDYVLEEMSIVSVNDAFCKMNDCCVGSVFGLGSGSFFVAGVVGVCCFWRRNRKKKERPIVRHSLSSGRGRSSPYRTVASIEE